MLNAATPLDARLTSAAESGWRATVPNVLLLLGAFLVSVQFQARVLMADPPAPLERAQPLAAFAVVAAAALIARIGLRPLVRRAGPARVQFAALVLALGLSALALGLLTPVPLTQIAFFAAAGAALGGFVILLRARLTRGRQRPDLIASVRLLWSKRDLVALWTRNNVRARYSQAILGVIWVILLPLAQAAIMAFVFSQFLRIPVGDVPFITFYLAALTPWTFIHNSVVQGSVSLINQMTLINQVYFPREIVPLVKLCETALDALFTFAALLVVSLLYGVLPNAHWLALPLLALITFAGAFGLALFLSVLTVYVRDVPQLSFVALQLLFYLTPIIYPADFIPEGLRPILMLNPLVPLIQSFRDVIVYNRPVDLISLYYPIVFAAALLFAGYSTFKAYERRLTDYI